MSVGSNILQVLEESKEEDAVYLYGVMEEPLGDAPLSTDDISVRVQAATPSSKDRARQRQNSIYLASLRNRNVGLV